MGLFLYAIAITAAFVIPVSVLRQSTDDDEGFHKFRLIIDVAEDRKAAAAEADPVVRGELILIAARSVLVVAILESCNNK